MDERNLEIAKSSVLCLTIRTLHSLVALGLDVIGLSALNVNLSQVVDYPTNNWNDANKRI